MALGRDVRERIEADRHVRVGGVEIADRVGALGRDAIRDRLGQVAVRIDHGDPFPGHDVVHGEVEQHRAFAGAGLADDVNMPLALSPREAEYRPRSMFAIGCCSIMPGQPLCEARGLSAGVPTPVNGRASECSRCGVEPAGRAWCGVPARYVGLPRNREAPCAQSTRDNSGRGVDSELLIFAGVPVGPASDWFVRPRPSGRGQHNEHSLRRVPGSTSDPGRIAGRCSPASTLVRGPAESVVTPPRICRQPKARSPPQRATMRRRRRLAGRPRAPSRAPEP